MITLSRKPSLGFFLIRKSLVGAKTSKRNKGTPQKTKVHQTNVPGQRGLLPPLVAEQVRVLEKSPHLVTVS